MSQIIKVHIVKQNEIWYSETGIDWQIKQYESGLQTLNNIVKMIAEHAPTCADATAAIRRLAEIHHRKPNGSWLFALGSLNGPCEDRERAAIKTAMEREIMSLLPGGETVKQRYGGGKM
jgi:hypothetical protein